MKPRRKKNGIAVSAPWLPMPLTFLRSRARAELSPHAAKLLLDVLAMMGPNATGNGDISLAPKLMNIQGWPGRQSLGAAVRELVDYGLLVQTRQGSRLDCSLYACTLFPIACDLRKLDIARPAHLASDYMCDGALASPPTIDKPAAWRRARKGVGTGRRKVAKVAPPRDEVGAERPAPGRTLSAKLPEEQTSPRPGTESPFSGARNVPPRVTFIEVPSASEGAGTHGLPLSRVRRKLAPIRVCTRHGRARMVA